MVLVFGLTVLSLPFVSICLPGIAALPTQDSITHLLCVTSLPTLPKIHYPPPLHHPCPRYSTSPPPLCHPPLKIHHYCFSYLHSLSRVLTAMWHEWPVPWWYDSNDNNNDCNGNIDTVVVWNGHLHCCKQTSLSFSPLKVCSLFSFCLLTISTGLLHVHPHSAAASTPACTHTAWFHPPSMYVFLYILLSTNYCQSQRPRPHIDTMNIDSHHCQHCQQWNHGMGGQCHDSDEVWWQQQTSGKSPPEFSHFLLLFMLLINLRLNSNIRKPPKI